jgi:hypothetical protein
MDTIVEDAHTTTIIISTVIHVVIL